eukprot:gene168-223_t
MCIVGLTLTYSPVSAKPGSAPAPKKQETVKEKATPSPSTKKSTAATKEAKNTLKEWTKRKHKLKPLQLQELVEENHKLRLQSQQLAVTIQELNGNIHGLEGKLKEAIQEKAKMISMAARDLAELPKGSYTVDKTTGQVFIGGILDERYGVDKETGIPYLKGVLFKVQIGANQNLDLQDVLIDEICHENLEQEKADNLYKYTIGHFRNYWEANKLKKGLRTMGIKLAWVVPYKDGKRVLLNEVLPMVIAQKGKESKHNGYKSVTDRKEQRKSQYACKKMALKMSNQTLGIELGKRDIIVL